MKITYYYQSGFSVELDHCVLVFDYWQEPLKTWSADKPVYVFVSHEHIDHYNPEIFKLKDHYQTVYYVLARTCPDVPEDVQATIVKHNQVVSVGDALVKTYFSTDAGVAYAVEIEGKRFLHFGDLNWWNWKDKPDTINDWQEKQFKKTLAKIQQDTYDVAFGPALDPRTDDAYGYGMSEFLTNCQVGVVFPMHFFEQTELVSRYIDQYKPEQYTHFMKIEYRNQEFEL